MKNNNWLSLTTGEKSQTTNRTRNEDSEGPRKFFDLDRRLFRKDEIVSNVCFFEKLFLEKKFAFEFGKNKQNLFGGKKLNSAWTKIPSTKNLPVCNRTVSPQ